MKREKLLLSAQASVLLLAWTAGCFDAINYMLFAVFPANMTGNTVLLGIGIGTGQGQHIERSGITLIAYCLGVFIATFIVGRSDQQRPWRPRFSLILGLETLLIIGFVVVRLLWGATISAIIPLLILAALAMGIQSVSAFCLGVAGIASTYITGTITTLLMEFATRIRAPFAARISKNSQEVPQRRQDGYKMVWQAATWVVYVFGAAIGAVTLTHLPMVAICLPLIGIALVWSNALLQQGQ
jgi:uncharacterized membrane protein YoaK (UPF0700 family)